MEERMSFYENLEYALDIFIKLIVKPSQMSVEPYQNCKCMYNLIFYSYKIWPRWVYFHMLYSYKFNNSLLNACHIKIGDPKSYKS